MLKITPKAICKQCPEVDQRKRPNQRLLKIKQKTLKSKVIIVAICYHTPKTLIVTSICSEHNYTATLWMTVNPHSVSTDDCVRVVSLIINIYTLENTLGIRGISPVCSRIPLGPNTGDINTSRRKYKFLNNALFLPALECYLLTLLIRM